MHMQGRIYVSCLHDYIFVSIRLSCYHRPAQTSVYILLLWLDMYSNTTKISDLEIYFELDY